MGASFPSITDIFVHILDAYRWWFLFVYFDRLSNYKRLRGQKRYSRREVVEEERRIDIHVMAFVHKLKPEDLDRNVIYKDGSQVKTIELRQMLLHMIEEELQHRGELNALLWQLDVDPPVTLYHEWARGRKAGRRMRF